MKLLQALRIDMKRAFFSPLFFLVILLIVALNYLSVSGEMPLSQGNVLYFFQLIFGGPFSIVMLFIGTLPYGTSFCVDWKNQFIRPNLIRTTLSTYAWSKVFTVALSAITAVIISNLLTAFLFSLHMPMVFWFYAEYGYELYIQAVIGQLIDIHPMLYLTVRIVIYALHCGFWAVFALLVSTYSTNAFVTYASPVLAYYLVVNLSAVVGVPYYLRFNAVASGYVEMGGIFASIAYSVLFFAVPTALLGWLTTRNIKRRVENG
ncbi:MAG: hypothetical protein FWH17_01165 [Oscillospiraceae bacterium]|nr:hypothetical protein [Oscillospiraceae bacterium]